MRAAPAPAPLTDRERRQLAALDRTAARGFARFFAFAAVVGLLGGLVVAAVLFGSAPPGSSFTLAERVPALAPIERAVGARAFPYAVAMALFGGAGALIAWRYWAALMGVRQRLRLRAERGRPAAG